MTWIAPAGTDLFLGTKNAIARREETEDSLTWLQGLEGQYQDQGTLTPLYGHDKNPYCSHKEHTYILPAFGVIRVDKTHAKVVRLRTGGVVSKIKPIDEAMLQCDQLNQAVF